MTRASGACATSRANPSTSCAGDVSDPQAAAHESTSGEPAAPAKPAPSKPGTLVAPAAPRGLVPAAPRSESAAPGKAGGTFRPSDAPRATPGARRFPTGVGAIPDAAACRRSAAARLADLPGYFEERVFYSFQAPCSRFLRARPVAARAPAPATATAKSPAIGPASSETPVAETASAELVNASVCV